MTDANVSAPTGAPSTAHNGNGGTASRVSPPPPTGAPLGQLPGPTFAERVDAWTDCIADHPATERLERVLTDLADKAMPSGSPARQAFSGAWLGQPLHPLLNDIPTGLWTSASVLDLISWRRSAAASRRLIGLGVLTALPTAAAGLAELDKLDKRGRRAASVHVALNLATLLLYLRSYGARRRRKHLRGALWALAGAGVGTAAGVLGGKLATSAYERAEAQRDELDLTDRNVPPV
jgi:uncharacterized membrane protein